MYKDYKEDLKVFKEEQISRLPNGGSGVGMINSSNGVSINGRIACINIYGDGREVITYLDNYTREERYLPDDEFIEFLLKFDKDLGGDIFPPKPKR